MRIGRPGIADRGGRGYLAAGDHHAVTLHYGVGPNEFPVLPGDGETAEGETAVHDYMEPGRYLMTLRVANDEGLEDWIRRAVTITCAASSNARPNSSRRCCVRV